MLALRKDFEAIENLKKAKLSFKEYIFLRDIVRGLARMKKLAIPFDIYFHSERIAKWLMKEEGLKVDMVLDKPHLTYSVKWGYGVK
jgi:hypothetical protein